MTSRRCIALPVSYSRPFTLPEVHISASSPPFLTNISLFAHGSLSPASNGCFSSLDLLVTVEFSDWLREFAARGLPLASFVD